ncbi:MAG: hypothetical protein QOH57_5396, partial [Mycobacterium sp.]|nr:hypothetical protein [Mycobacterium sp.]
EGDFFSARAVNVAPKPAKALDIWLGGAAPAAFRRIGALGDGWLGSFLTPTEARHGREAIAAAADAAGRQIEPDHYGINIAVGDGRVPPYVLEATRRRRPDLDPSDVIATDWPQLHRMLDGYVAAGLTKFVIRPVGTGTTDAFVNTFCAELLARQN